MRLARLVLHVHCDVLVVGSFVELATLTDAAPAMALVHFGRHVPEIVLEGMVARWPTIEVVALYDESGLPMPAVQGVLERCGVRASECLAFDAPFGELARAVQTRAFR
jgi:hypothetical protein